MLALQQLGKLPHAPSVELHDVPPESLTSHLGMPEVDELDEEIARMSICMFLVHYPILFPREFPHFIPPSRRGYHNF
jgi:hypothetical protein